METLGERVCADQLLHGLEIGMALAAAIATPASPLQLNPIGDDGGYLLVCGVAGYYAASATHGSLAAHLAPSLLAALGPTATPITLALRVQRRLAALRGR